MSPYDVDSQLSPLFDKAFQDTKAAVFVAKGIWEGTFDPYHSDSGWLPPPLLSNKLKPENLGATLQELRSALDQAKASVKKVGQKLIVACGKFPFAHAEVLEWVEDLANSLHVKHETKRWPDNFDRSPTKAPDWDALIKACFGEAHRAASKNEEFGVPKRTGERHLQILPGGIGCKDAAGEDVSVQIGGKTLAIIRELIDAYQEQLDWTKLSQRIWGADAYTDKATIKNAVADARDALRKLARKADVHVTKNYDPLPCVNRGKDLAWKLDF
jgi:hypothetical protein